ncbi:hypothetical protein SNOG_13902 [Parastagonospora nodorum SN15]|uniref:Uncharacterized protein n=1 Tax=Phaeosphaeria nodorum (strain SN15 / ATCC MYA-4574 / FGSC 10173) TaxID=321614 RepID=Q0U2N2_PHANO|nr:hypothetical protein SNOG_13902 [Parastagonospora nodorum SN15]EAT78527.2 hypothetical protein SNOG_13902 [Parastagonospora nodorum SN15]
MEIRKGEDLDSCNFWIILNVPPNLRNVDGADLKCMGYTSSKSHYERMKAANLLHVLDLRSFVIPPDRFVEEIKAIIEHFNNNSDWFGEFVSDNKDVTMQTLIWSLYPELSRKLAFPLKSLNKAPERGIFEGIFENDIAHYKVGVPSATDLEENSDFWILESAKVRAHKPEGLYTGRGYTQCEDHARWFLKEGDCTIQSYKFGKGHREVDLLNRFIGQCALNQGIGCGWGTPERTSAFFYVYYKQNQPRSQTLEKGMPWPAPAQRPEENH